jgi:hypothetical protein
MTAGSTNTIVGHLPTQTASSGKAPQIGFNMTGASTTTNGTCRVVTPLTISTNEIDYLVHVAGAVVDTGTTAFISLLPIDIPFECVISVAVGDTASMNVWLQSEDTTVVTVKKGAMYQIFKGT